MTLRVNGEPIPDGAIQYELDRLVKFYSDHMSAEQIKQQMESLRRRARDQAIGAKLLIAEAARLDLPVPGREIEERLQAMIESAGSEAAFEQLLERKGLTANMVRDSIQNGRRVDILIEQIAAEVSDPTEAEIRAHFDQHKEEYTRPERAQAQHILIECSDDTDTDRQVARSRILEIRQRIQDGAAFEDEAAEHSACPSGVQAGGNLGWFSRGMMVPEFDEAVFAMDVDALSEPVETPLGFHIIRKAAHEEGGPATFEDVREKIRDFLRHVRRGEGIAAYVEDLKQQAVIEEA